MKQPSLLAVLLCYLLPVLLLWPVTFGGKTLIPADNLFAFQPWRSFAAQFNAAVPHNELLNDLLLENYAWKKFIVDSLQQGQLPLWNPYVFTGVPFLAAGQHSALYPFSVLFYLFPIEHVYGWFVALQLGIAGTAMFVFARTLGLGRFAACVSALTYELSGFFVISIVFPMVISAACWLPLLLLCEEKIIRALRTPRRDKGDENDPRNETVVGWIVLGAITLCVSLLAGHVEIAYYNLMVMAFYGLWRIWQSSKFTLLLKALGQAVQASKLKAQGSTAEAQWINHSASLTGFIPQAFISLSVMVALGLALAAVQYVPLYELVSRSFRQGSQSYETIIGYAYPVRQLITFFVPDFFGNPSHHSYFDLFTWQTVPVTRNVRGEPIHTIFWGIKNYVEAASYLGILPLLLAPIALIHWIVGVRYWRTSNYQLPITNTQAPSSNYTGFFAVLALLSLAFVFGTPLYALLFYGLPGINQLHSPFRWVYPYTLSIAVLAGIGAQILGDNHLSIVKRQIVALISYALITLGALLLVAFIVTLIAPSLWLPIAERILRGSDLAQSAFPDARAFLSYEAINLAKFAFFLLSAGFILWLARRSTQIHVSRFTLHTSISLWQPLALLLLIAELFAYGYGFNPAADPQALKFVPSAVKFLQEDTSLYRIATLNAEGEKTFNANVGMYYGLQDIRGYDSIIPKQYADWMNLIEGQGELIYNRIAPFYWHGSLDSALLDLANVKYVLTTQAIPNTTKFTQVYTGELNIYRNERVLPRAFMVRPAFALQELKQLQSLDPRREVLLERNYFYDALAALTAPCTPLPTPIIKKYSANEVIIETGETCAALLVLTDAYFEGWQAFAQTGNTSEREIKIYRANGNFRAVELSAGRHTVRFRYNPLSFRVGALLSFFAAMATLLLSGYWAWGRFRRNASTITSGQTREASRVLKNSALPMLTSLLNKAIDTVYTAFMLRVLGAADAGKLGFTTIFIGYCDIFINFGLSTWVTREVARNRALSNRYLSNTIIVRIGLLLALAPLLAGILWAWRAFSDLSDDTTLAIVLFAVGLIPSSIAAALSSIFYAHERMEYPAAVTVVTTLLKVSVNTFMLLAGYGIVGLAAANILVNIATLLILLVLFIRKFFMPRPEFDGALGRSLLRESYPLMLNDSLSRAFNRVDVLMLKTLQPGLAGDLAVGWYSTTYKYLEGINILPSTFTIALFPLLTRYAAGAPDVLMRAYLKAMKYLVIIAMPLMVWSFVYADAIMWLFGGSAFLPGSAIALRFIIGFLPFSFINNVTHYVLIAANQQRYLTRTFIIGASFNLIANLIFIPLYSYQAAAIITICSEIVLLGAFYVGIRRHVGRVNWLGLLWQPCIAALAMGVFLGMWGIGGLGLGGAGAGGQGLGLGGFLFATLVSLLIYASTLLLLRTLDADDWEMVRLILPQKRR